MSGFRRWSRAEIEASLEGRNRQYLVGNLQQTQILDFMRDDRLEVGISAYCRPTAEQPHRHRTATEFQYVISGMTQYLDVETAEVHEFRAGDFYSITYPTAYAQKSKPGTRILFVKVPSVNDKIAVPATDETREWLTRPMTTIRTDYFHDPKAPAANSLRPAAAVALVNESREVLLLRRGDSGNWTMPGGTQEFGESLAECAVREVREETALDVVLGGIIGTYTDPGVCVAYSDGEVRQEFTVLYFGRTVGGAVRLDAESTEHRWVPFTELGELALAESQRRRLTDVVAYVDSGVQRCG